MNITKRTIGAAALAITLTVGGATAALAGSNNDGSAGVGRQARIAKICADPDTAIAKLTEHQTKLTDRIAELQLLRSKAESAGHTKLVARLDKRIDTLQQRLDKTTERIAGAPAWIVEHCS
ncbi:MAG: hypothetical protein ABIR32_21435 [Ilumatobacteraceae bacterium]